MILLIRHGETDSNAARVFQHPEAPLSARGREQARRLARRLAGEGIRHILSSDYRRAEATARALESAAGCTLALEPLLRERHFGELRGKPYASIGGNPFAPDFVPPGGESVPAFEARVARAWECIRQCAAAAAGPVAVVTHGLVCRALALNHAALPEAERSSLAFANTSLTLIELAPPFRITLLACTAHLRDAD